MNGKALRKEYLSAKPEKRGGGKETQQNRMKACQSGGREEVEEQRAEESMSDCLSD